MESEEKPEKKVKNKKRAAIVATIVVVGGAAAVLSVSGKSGDLLSFLSGNNKNSQTAGSQADIKRPDREADIVGFVESIKGNEVTILKMDMSQMPGTDRTGSGTDNSDTDDSSTEAKVSLGQDSSGTNMQRPQRGQGGRPEGGAGETGNTSARAEMMAELKKNSTGTEIVTVPVGILMTKRDTTAQKNSTSGGSKTRGGAAEVEASLSDIVVDQMVTIWLNQDVTDRNIAEFVSIAG